MQTSIERLRAPGPERRVLGTAGLLLAFALIGLTSQREWRLATLERAGPVQVSQLRSADAERDRIVELAGASWRCDQAVVGRPQSSLRKIRTWVPVEDGSGTPRLVVMELGASKCVPREGGTGVLTRDGGLLGAGLPPEEPFTSMRRLPILVIEPEGADPGGDFGLFLLGQMLLAGLAAFMAWLAFGRRLSDE